MAHIPSLSVTVSREELHYAMVAGAAMQTHDQVEELQTQLQQNVTQGASTSNAPDKMKELKRDIKLLKREL